MGWIGCVRCELFGCDYMAQTSVLVASVQSVWHRVSCSNEILPNTPKHYETHQNMSLGSNVFNWVCSLQKILMHCMARTSALIARFQSVLHRVSCSNDTLPNAPKYYETQQNMSLGPMGWIGCVRCEKFYAISWNKLLH